MAATKQEKEIIRTINVKGETFGPGEEDAMVEALQAHEDEQDENGKFTVKDELKRLESLGAIVGFADVADDEYVDADADVRATRKNNPHLLQDKRPLQPAGPTPPTMDDIRAKPDDNVVAEKLAGGKKETEADAGKLAAAQEEAAEELAASQVQQESEQVPAPEGGKTKAKGKKAKANKK
jgi:hypothetical protein